MTARLYFGLPRRVAPRNDDASSKLPRSRKSSKSSCLRLFFIFSTLQNLYFEYLRIIIGVIFPVNYEFPRKLFCVNLVIAGLTRNDSGGAMIGVSEEAIAI